MTCRCNTERHDPDCHIDHTLSVLEADIAFPQRGQESNPNPTVRTQLEQALHNTQEVVHRGFCLSGRKDGTRPCWKECTEATAALARAKAEPEWLSQCCGAPPHESSDIVAPTTTSPIGVCGKCREHTAFERAEPEGCICSDCPTCAVSVRECQCADEGRKSHSGWGQK